MTSSINGAMWGVLTDRSGVSINHVAQGKRRMSFKIAKGPLGYGQLLTGAKHRDATRGTPE
jgi:hypothetical protein